MSMGATDAPRSSIPSQLLEIDRQLAVIEKHLDAIRCGIVGPEPCGEDSKEQEPDSLYALCSSINAKIGRILNIVSAVGNDLVVGGVE
jgi:hypothetical protein